MKKKPMIAIGGILLVLSVMGLLFARPKSSNLKEQYDFFTVRRQDLVEEIDATGQVEAQVKKDLYTDFEAMVKKINVKAGDHVKQGDVLMTLESAVLKEQFQEAQSVLEQARLGSKQATSQFATEVAVNQITENNLLQLGNYYHQWALSQKQEEQAKDRLKALNAKNDGVYSVKDNELVIRAPFAGQVGWINVRQGEKVTPQTLMATMVRPDALVVEAKVDQNDISWIKLGQSATVIGKDEEQSENHGKVAEISGLGQADGDVIGFPVRILLDTATQGLQPGMTVDVTVLAKNYPDALVVPAGSVTQKDGQYFVNLLRGDRVVTQKVQIGLKQGKFWEIKSGVKAGDQVATPKMASTSKRPMTSGAAGHGGMAPLGRR